MELASEQYFSSSETPHLVTRTAEMGQLEMLKLLISRGFQFNLRAIESILKYATDQHPGCQVVLDWLTEQLAEERAEEERRRDELRVARIETKFRAFVEAISKHNERRDPLCDGWRRSRVRACWKLRICQRRCMQRCESSKEASLHT
jgi:hypothetical protein